MPRIKEIYEPLPSVVRHVVETNKHMSREEAMILAVKMEKCYDEVNKDHDEQWNIEYQNDWNRLHQVENDCWTFETLSGDDILDYFGVLDV